MNRLTHLLTLLLFIAAPAQAQIRFTETGGGSEYVSLQAPSALSGNISWLFPSTDGSTNQCLSTNGSGTLQWRTPGGTSSALDASDGSPVNAVYVNSTGKVGIGTTSPTAGAVLDLAGTGTVSSVIVPRDTDANRPTGVNGMIRYNTTSNLLEGYQEGAWIGFRSGFMGKLSWTGINNCLWPNAAGATWADIPADTNCNNPTVSGGATAPGTKVPAITIANLPPGTYEVTFSAQIYNYGGGNCFWRISDGTTGAGLVFSEGAAVTESQPTINGIFTYTSTATRTFKVQGFEGSGTAGDCMLVNDEQWNFAAEMWVKRL